MRPTLRPDNLTERIALRLNLAPVPVGEAMFGQALARTVIAGVRLGVFAALCERDMSSDESLAGIWTLCIWSTRTPTPESFVKRLASSSSFTSEVGA